MGSEEAVKLRLTVTSPPMPQKDVKEAREREGWRKGRRAVNRTGVRERRRETD